MMILDATKCGAGWVRRPYQKTCSACAEVFQTYFPTSLFCPKPECQAARAERRKRQASKRSAKRRAKR